MENYYSAQGLEITKGSYVDFTSTGYRVIGKVVDFIGGKIVCIPVGTNCPDKSELKKQYKILAKNCWSVNIRKKEA